MKKIWKKGIAFMLAMVLTVTAVHVPVYAQENSMDVPAGTATEREIETETREEAEIEAENETGAETEAENRTKTEIEAGNEGKIIDEKAETGNTVSGNEAGIPQEETESPGWDGVTTEAVYEADHYKVTFKLASNWENGYNANIKLENTGEEIIQNWHLGFNYNSAITKIWNAEISASEGNKYVIKNAGWNQDIAAGGSIAFGISGNHAFQGFPESYGLIGTIAEVAKEEYTITYHAGNDWGSGFGGSISITNNTDKPLEDWVLEFDFTREITQIWNGVMESREGKHYVVKNAEYNSTIAAGASISIGIEGRGGNAGDEPADCVLYSYRDTIDLNRDSDGDNAPDYLEDYFGTDKRKTDTDGDGLSDYIELYSLVLDPRNADTDGDGICDGDEDLDGDGLTNGTEVQIGTSIVKTDTDGDGLSDFDENRMHGTDPLKEDTDGDGVSDAKEIELGTNPLVFDKTFQLNLKADSTDTVEVSVETALPGEQAESLTVKRYENKLFFPETMPGYIGGAYDFSVDGEIEKAKINFKFDKALLADPSFDPVIYYFNEETQQLEELDTVVEGNAASAEVTHFSKYILLNRKVFQDAFKWQDVWTSTGYSGVEVVLVIDDSGSMGWNDSTNQRLSVARNLIDKLPDNSKVGVVKFESAVSKLTTTIAEDKEKAKSYLTTSYFRSSGGTNMYSAINSAFSLYESTDDNIMKMMVVLSDGATSDTGRHAAVVSAANDRNVKIYTVGLGSSSSYFNSYLKPLANNTAGAFYLASEADQLEDIYNDINEKIDIETDSDGDGIADYYEENMVLFNGVTMKLDKNNPDSDGDGLLDGEEAAELNYKYNEDRTQVIVTGKILSNPLEADSDGDGISDEEELIIGTNPNNPDSDGDGLEDGTEYVAGFDPLAADMDGDGRLDLQEYQEGTDPYCYNKEWWDYTWDFICGFVAGDFIADTDSLPTIMGQVTSSFIPFVDVRDVVGNLANGDYTFAGLSALGLVPVLGDATKTAGKIGKFAVKNLDDIPKIAGLLEFLSKNFPDAVKVLNKSDDFVDAARQLSKLDNIKLTRKQAKVITEAFENAGLAHYLVKTGNSLDLRKTFDIGAEVWEEGAIKRGSMIDEFVNQHLSGGGLGKNFPVADRVDERILVSTKSLDIAAQSYQKPNKLKRMLEKYGDSLQDFEKKYFKDADKFRWGDTTLSITQYDKKALEIILPDVIITEESLKVLNDFKAVMEKSGMEIWYCITK